MVSCQARKASSAQTISIEQELKILVHISLHTLRSFFTGDNATYLNVCFCAAYTCIKFLNGIRLGFFLSRLFIKMISKPAFVGC